MIPLARWSVSSQCLPLLHLLLPVMARQINAHNHDRQTDSSAPSMPERTLGDGQTMDLQAQGVHKLKATIADAALLEDWDTVGAGSAALIEMTGCVERAEAVSPCGYKVCLRFRQDSLV